MDPFEEHSIDSPVVSRVESQLESNIESQVEFQIDFQLDNVGTSYTLGKVPLLVPMSDSADVGYIMGKCSHAIRSHELIVEKWNLSLQRFTLNLLLLPDAKQKWCAIDVLRRGYSTDSHACRPTIVITVHSLQTVMTVKGDLNARWKYIATSLFHECQRQNVPVDIELIEGQISRTFDPSTAMPWKGASIGPQKIKSSGSLGGYVTLEEESGIFAMTCHHVLSPYTSNSLQGKINSFIVIFNLLIFLIEDISQIVDSPSSSDYQEYLNKLHKTRDLKQKEMNDYLKMKQAQGTSEECSGSINRQRRLQVLDNVINEIENYNSEFGHVFASSGLRVGPSGSCLDWALIKVTRNQMSNFDVSAPNNTFYILSVTHSILQAKDDRELLHYENTADKADIKLHDKVAKFGRSTGFTEGYHNAIESHVQWKEGAALTRELCAVSSFKDFSEIGDSGAWILNEQNQVVGMIFAGNKVNYNRVWTYFTAIDQIFEDIEKVTGRRVQILSELN